MDKINPKRMKKYFDTAAPVVAFALANGDGVQTYKQICPPLEEILNKGFKTSRERRAGGITGFKIMQAWQRGEEGLSPWADTPGETDLDTQVHFACLTQRENRCVYLKVRCNWPFKQVGADMGVTEDNARQIYHRIKKKLAAEKYRPGGKE